LAWTNKHVKYFRVAAAFLHSKALKEARVVKEGVERGRGLSQLLLSDPPFWPPIS